jgi:hypothetical protein
VIRIQIKREVDVPEEAAVEVASELLEWLDKKGFSLVPRPQSLAATMSALREADYRQLSEKFVEEWS